MYNRQSPKSTLLICDPHSLSACLTSTTRPACSHLHSISNLRHLIPRLEDALSPVSTELNMSHLTSRALKYSRIIFKPLISSPRRPAEIRFTSAFIDADLWRSSGGSFYALPATPFLCRKIRPTPLPGSNPSAITTTNLPPSDFTDISSRYFIKHFARAYLPSF